MRIQCLAQAMVVLLMMTGAGIAGEADVVGAKASKSSDGTWTFDVTVAHADEGWDHYANRWDVVAPDGTYWEPARCIIRMKRSNRSPAHCAA